jgi:hypothetical protein
LDFDNNPDLLVGVQVIPSPSELQVFPGKGDGTFGPAARYPLTGPFSFVPSAIVVADFDGDCALDVALSTSIGIDVLLGSHDGSLQPRTSYPAPGALLDLEQADLNADGHPDIAAPDSVNDQMCVFIGQGDGSFLPAQCYPLLPNSDPGSVAISDLDGDGAQDIVATQSLSNTVAILYGRGDGSFDPFSSMPGSAEEVEIADQNGDLILDVITGGGLGCAGVLFGQGNRTFAPVQYFAGPGVFATGVLAEDVDGDLLLDVITACSNMIVVYPNQILR